MTRDADLASRVEQRDSWIAAAELRRILTEAPADEGLLADLAEVRASTVDEP